MRIAVAPNPVFFSLQGEGHLRGFPMVFVRLAGCSVGCPGCDTDYSVWHKRTIGELHASIIGASPRHWRDRWVWITGGEPTDQLPHVKELVARLKGDGFSVAVATSGHKRFVPPVDWLSVSPHDPKAWTQLYGNEVKLVPGLNGFTLDDFVEAHPDHVTDFFYRYAQPLWKDGAEDPDSLATCLEWLRARPNWALSRQDHKHWSMP